MDISRPTIASIMWVAHRPESHELRYPDGRCEHVQGGLEDAVALAESLRMVLVSTFGDSVSWSQKR
jgi:hypothetical protein